MNRKVLEKVQTLDGKKDKVFCKVTLEHEIELDLKEQEVNKVKKKVPSEVVSEGKKRGNRTQSWEEGAGRGVVGAGVDKGDPRL